MVGDENQTELTAKERMREKEWGGGYMGRDDRQRDKSEARMKISER